MALTKERCWAFQKDDPTDTKKASSMVGPTVAPMDDRWAAWMDGRSEQH